MKLLDLYRSRKYFMRLVFSFALLASILLIVFGSLFYSFSQRSAMKLQLESTGKVLKQVNYNIDNLYDAVLNFTISTFSDRDISVLMQNRDMDIFDLYNRLQKFDYIVNSNLFVDSLLIYNGHNGCYYISPQSVPVQCAAGSQSNILKRYQNDHAEIPDMKFMPVQVSENKEQRNLLTLFKKEAGSILMVNVKPQWLFDNVRAINGLADSALGDVMMFDADGKMLEKDASDGGDAAAKQAVIRQIDAKKEPEGYFTLGSGNGKKLVMYSTSATTGWRIVGMQSYKAAFGSLDQIRTFSFLLLSGFIVLTLFASTFISMKLYKPIGSLMQSLRTMPARIDGVGGKDELAFLTLFNQRMLEEMAKLEQGNKATESIARDYFLRRLLLERQKMSGEEFSEQVRLHGLKLTEANGEYIVCLLRIDNALVGGETAELHKFAVQNIAEEMFHSFALSVSVQLGNEFVTMLLSVPQAAEQRLGELPRAIAKLQDVVRSYYHIGLCASVSSAVDHHERLSEAYEQALLLSEYRMIYGRTAVITPELVAVNERGDETQLDDALEKKWLESIRTGNMNAIEQQLVKIFKRLTDFRIDHLLQSLQYLTAITVNHLKDMHLDDTHAVKASLLSFNRRVMERETLDDVLLQYIDLFRKVTEPRQTSTDDKNRILAAALKEAIEKHYSDPNLSLQFLATKLKMSKAHLSKVYKQCESESLNDYINKVRIMRAVSELQNTDTTISQIMFNVGFVSESYFYKIFKQSIGATPREFRTNHALSKD
ncbi:helix-turn-helix domain-containing protein [Paenibacillus sacheonensis]|uniref:Helix-turn-helix domain-containing protein n=1 Tax=Paenibacillus sacheonensis TaxID=742054 RepID=A0A7X4YM36_9BACL|nr:helix-turn-helix domain-containing protein [Paenibacillus sacheonensis]MBM7565791.1 AraC-like DNA-binding protein [Paenibacillus sacheonensis]NBC68888.1 helix-turn-helix domain-containing protein [Paenibacillus sacheonensis]